MDASVWPHDSASETPACRARKIFNHPLLDVPFLLHDCGKLLGIYMCIIFDVKHCSIHLTWITLFITLMKILWGKNYYFPILEMRKLRQTEVTSKQKGSPFCHRSSTHPPPSPPRLLGRGPCPRPQGPFKSSPSLFLICLGADIFSKSGTL